MSRLARRLLVPCLALVVALAGAAAAEAQYYPPGDDPPPAGSCPNGVTKVTISGSTFSPSTVTIPAGGRVCWQNEDIPGMPHNVVSNTPGLFSSGSPSDAQWAYVQTFDDPGTFAYYCQVHGSPTAGMRGTVVVEGGGNGGGGSPGSLRFSATSYSVGENAGSATITVQRINGDDGAVSVSWSATAGSASASDFTPGSGTLQWGDGDDSDKTFTVAITNDSADESNETVNLALSNATGGAGIVSNRSTATLTIVDDDNEGNDDPPPPTGTPTAPNNLRQQSQGLDEVVLTWNDRSDNETGFRIERRTLHGSFVEAGTVGPNVETFTATGLEPGTLYLFRVRANGNGGNSAFTSLVAASTAAAPGACTPGPGRLCINGGRFAVEVDWRTAADEGSGTAVPLPSAPDSGLFYFFDSANIELLIKAINGCTLNNRYWVFYAATTNVEVGILVTDTATGTTKPYFNPLNTPAPPVQDTSAFSSCP